MKSKHKGWQHLTGEEEDEVSRMATEKNIRWLDAYYIWGKERKPQRKLGDFR